MKPKQQKDLEGALSQIIKYKPDQSPKKPEKTPSAKQLKQGWKLVRR